jgi:hypothetical protein
MILAIIADHYPFFAMLFMQLRGKLDRSAYLREILKKGFSLDKQERVMQKYATGEMSQMEVCRTLEWNPWQFTEELRARNLHLNVSLEDFLHSSRLPGK